ncbi:MAG: ParB/RepB/Spo0J family partition protein [Verrucomicrobia bacterium]|nr:ParB/RepB/Spo0J family partition protein [Verrucomicrobiota bacterium]
MNLAPTGLDEPKLSNLPLSLIDPDPNQPRRALGDLTDLALSIRQQGLLNPIIVEAVGGRFRILAGERRFAACRSLGWESVTCLVRTVEEQSRLALQLIENMHRKDLSPLEEAQGLRRLMEEFGLSQRDLAQRIGRSTGSVNQILRILDLDPDLLNAVQMSEPVSKSVLLEIAKQTDPARQGELLEQAKAGQLTVREARAKKPRSSVSKVNSVTIVLPDCSVVVRFAVSEATPDRTVEALRAAAVTLASGKASDSDV